MTERNPGRALSRRRLLQGLGAGAVVGVAGCAGGDSGSGGAGEADDGWRAATLEEATTGEEFRIEEFEEPTIVHTFAANCVTCANQQTEFVTLRDRRDDIELVELTVDPNDTPADIAAHAESAGLEWQVSVPPESVIGRLVDQFGQEVAVSAQSPIIIVCPDGRIDTLSKVADADELERAVDDRC